MKILRPFGSSELEVPRKSDVYVCNVYVYDVYVCMVVINFVSEKEKN